MTSLPKIRLLAIMVLSITIGATLFANVLAPAGYEHQFRDSPNASPSSKHLLGTDDLGRDRFARLLYGGRVSLLLAPLAAALSTVLAAFVGGLAGYFGGWLERMALVVMDLLISIPVFIITEANLGALGLGVSEPLPSLGSLLRELQNVVTLRPEPWRFIPLAVLVIVVSSFEILLNRSSNSFSEVRA